MDIVTLDVGGTHFRTYRTTLKQAKYFENVNWEADGQEDGSFFIDADPDLFQYILQFLRRGTGPIFWDLKNGHDYPRYNAVLTEAEHFHIPGLVEWLKLKRYRSVIRTEICLYQWAEKQKRQYISAGEEEVYFVSDRTTYIRSVEFEEKDCKVLEAMKVGP